MPSTNPQCFHLSASSIGSFKACPNRFRLAYREGLRVERDTDSQRCGTNWHAMHEEYANAYGESIAIAGLTGPVTDYHENNAKEDAMSKVVALLNERYANVPSWIDAQAWALERQVLLTSFIGYLWYWQNDPVEFLASEVPFNLPLHEPRTGMPCSMESVQRVGKIDHVVKWQGAICNLERKSTTRGIAPDSDYWEKSKKDTQVSMYALAFQDMIQAGTFPQAAVMELAFGRAARVGNTLYDVWHKPTMKPSMLTQAETKALIESGSYCGQAFVVKHVAPDPDNTAGEHVVTADGEQLTVEVGKKAIAVRESIAMFGARLIQNIYERPDLYYARREIARTAAEISEFRGELFAIYQAQQAFSRHGFWFSNESSCRATFPCSYIPICFGPGARSVCDGKTTPTGFKRIFVDLTINGKEVEE